MAFSGTTRFEILGKLGQGGMGVVYEAYDRALGAKVALEVLEKLDAANLYRFKREFRAMRDFTHPNIVKLYELIAERDVWFFTMELVPGQDFISYVSKRRPREAEDTTVLVSRSLHSPQTAPTERPLRPHMAAGCSRADLA